MLKADIDKREISYAVFKDMAITRAIELECTHYLKMLHIKEQRWHKYFYRSEELALKEIARLNSLKITIFKHISEPIIVK